VDPLFLDKSNPDIYAHMVGTAQAVTAAAADAGLDRLLVELVNLRVSQINGCAFCLDLHSRRALKEGESAQRIAVLTTWREAAVYSEMERAALEVAEFVTLLPGPEKRKLAEARAREILSDTEYAAVAWLAVAMNAFNRVSITSCHPVRPQA
jgi:AhpD family alkylhydroperoxidase